MFPMFALLALSPFSDVALDRRLAAAALPLLLLVSLEGRLDRSSGIEQLGRAAAAQAACLQSHMEALTKASKANMKGDKQEQRQSSGNQNAEPQPYHREVRTRIACQLSGEQRPARQT